MLMFQITSLLTLLAAPAFGVIFQKGREQGFDNDFEETTNSMFQSQCIDIHNQFRRMHGAPALSYSPQLASYARRRAMDLARKDGTNFYHPDGLPYGENLAWNSQSSVDCGLPLKLWYDEWKIYNFNRPNISPANGHFTQMVWKQSRSIGCAQVRSRGKNGGTYTVCNYDPPGNYENEERENVQPAMGTSGGYDVTPDIQSYRRKKIRRTWIRTTTTGGFRPVSSSGGGNWLTVQMPPSNYDQSVSTPISSIFGGSGYGGSSFGSSGYGSSSSGFGSSSFGGTSAFGGFGSSGFGSSGFGSSGYGSSGFGSSGFGSSSLGSSWGSGLGSSSFGSSYGSGLGSLYSRSPFSSSYGSLSSTTAAPSFSYGGFGGFGSFGGNSLSSFGGSGDWNSWNWKKK